MREDFYQIYRELYREFSFSHSRIGELDPIGTPRANRNMVVIRRIQNIIDEQEYSDTNRIIRPDAKYFLLLNLYQMVALPILLSTSQPRKKLIPASKLETDLETDIKLILKESWEIALEKQNDETPQEESNLSTTSAEITGHSIITSLNKIWKKLKVNDYAYWT